ncbi:cell division protein sepF [Firmicutes bacterium CAG:884]|nr:cell division protein SepF [Bacillota bacterium]CCY94511.1 cell division protein sepF [Firmicutes bacterium CAG:884]
MGINIKKIFSTTDESNKMTAESVDEYYNVTEDEALETNDGKTKMILVEPRAYSESVQISDYLKMRNSVVVNLQRVTADQGKRIVDFLSGTIYAIGGDMQKIGNGIFLCTPRNMNVEGKITEDKDENKDGIETEW